MKKMLSYRPQKAAPVSAPAAGLCVLVALAGGPAMAQSLQAALPAPEKSLQLFGGLGVGHDDNLLRVADDAPAFDNQRGDSWLQGDVGLVFDHTYSRQRLSAQARYSKVKFDHFSQLDYNGQDVKGKWNWQVGNHLEGTVGADYNQTLAPYTDFRSDQRNLRQQRRLYADGAWRFHPSYRVRAGAAKEKFSYELVEQSVNDRTENSYEVGADYLPKSGSEFGVVVRTVKGEYPNPRFFAGRPLNIDYDQDEVKARVLWLATGTTTVQALAGWTKRKQRALGDDTTGFNGRISAEYKPNGVFSYSAAFWRDFAPIESTTISYSLNKGVNVAVTWQASAKIKVDASATYEQRNYNPRLAGLANGDLDDSLRSASLRATWAPQRALLLSAALAHQSRSGSVFLGTGSFDSTSIVVNAIAQF
jgi:exopolysaccharide biosynthesis operon protein EpsL